MEQYCLRWRLKPSATETVSSVFHLHSTGMINQGTRHFAECRKNRPVTMRNANKSPKILNSAMVREVEK